MDFSIPEEYLNYQQKVTDFAHNNLNDNIIERDHEGSFARDLWQKCADFGIQGLATPAAYGGALEEVNLFRAVLAMQGLGYGCKDNGLAFGLNAQMWNVQIIIALFGTEEQKQKYLPKLTDGTWIGAHALTEEASGSDTFNMQMTAEKVDGGYVLNGEKRLITLAPVADMAIIFASTNPKLKKWGITAFLLENTMEGFHVSPTRHKMGCRTVPFGEIKLENCFVPEENRFGKEGAGFSLSHQTLEYDRCFILASQLGAMERQLEECIDYVKNRKQFGHSIGKFQSISNKIAEMKLRLETSKLLLHKMVWLKEQGKPCVMEASLLKLQLSESFVASSLDAIRIHGGNGYLTDYGVERNLRDAVGGVIYAGTSEIQRNIIARLLGL
ncbi:MAG: acyl-CoA dehydrogenase family protein [Bacteroidota bacterium]